MVARFNDLGSSPDTGATATAAVAIRTTGMTRRCMSEWRYFLLLVLAAGARGNINLYADRAEVHRITGEVINLTHVKVLYFCMTATVGRYVGETVAYTQISCSLAFTVVSFQRHFCFGLCADNPCCL